MFQAISPAEFIRIRKNTATTVERCDRHIKDVLAIQEEIARAILLRLKNTIA